MNDRFNPIVIPMREKYRNEDKRFYCTEETRKNYLAKYDDKLYVYNKEKTQFEVAPQNSKYIFVYLHASLYVCNMDSLDVIHHLEGTGLTENDLTEKDKKIKFHHSYFLGSTYDYVHTAGEIEVDEKSVISMLTLRSGHYHPELQPSMAVFYHFSKALSTKVFIDSYDSKKVTNKIETYKLKHLVDYFDPNQNKFIFDDDSDDSDNKKVTQVSHLIISEREITVKNKIKISYPTKQNTTHKHSNNNDTINKKNKNNQSRGDEYKKIRILENKPQQSSIPHIDFNDNKNTIHFLNLSSEDNFYDDNMPKKFNLSLDEKKIKKLFKITNTSLENHHIPKIDVFNFNEMSQSIDSISCEIHKNKNNNDDSSYDKDCFDNNRNNNNLSEQSSYDKDCLEKKDDNRLDEHSSYDENCFAHNNLDASNTSSSNKEMNDSSSPHSKLSIFNNDSKMNEDKIKKKHPKLTLSLYKKENN